MPKKKNFQRGRPTLGWMHHHRAELVLLPLSRIALPLWPLRERIYCQVHRRTLVLSHQCSTGRLSHPSTRSAALLRQLKARPRNTLCIETQIGMQLLRVTMLNKSIRNP